MRGGGQTARRPSGRAAPRRYGCGSTLSCIQTRSSGSSMMPVSMPFSQWSHQRTASCRKPIAGPGTPLCGKPCAHGPISPFFGHGRPAQQARHGVGIAVRPAADRVDRAVDRAVVLADRAVLPEVVAPLVLQPERRERHQVVEALAPHLAPALADDLRDRADTRRRSSTSTPHCRFSLSRQPPM